MFKYNRRFYNDCKRNSNNYFTIKIVTRKKHRSQSYKLELKSYKIPDTLL